MARIYRYRCGGYNFQVEKMDGKSWFLHIDNAMKDYVNDWPTKAECVAAIPTEVGYMRKQCVPEHPPIDDAYTNIPYGGV
ncbi:hypothetical protein [Rhizobium phage RHEph12]|nr:hypothetical protein [Rhizobium phage RHEph12]